MEKVIHSIFIILDYHHSRYKTRGEMAVEGSVKDGSTRSSSQQLLPVILFTCIVLQIMVYVSTKHEYFDWDTLYRQRHERQQHFNKRGGLFSSSFLSTTDFIENFDVIEKTHLLFSYSDSSRESRYLLENEDEMILLSSSLPDREQPSMRRNLKKSKNDDDIFDEDIDATVVKPSQKPYYREILLVGDSLLTVPELFFNISHLIRDDITQLHSEFEIAVSSVMKGGLTIEDISRVIHKKFDDRGKIDRPYPDVVSVCLHHCIAFEDLSHRDILTLLLFSAFDSFLKCPL